MSEEQQVIPTLETPIQTKRYKLVEKAWNILRTMDDAGLENFCSQFNAFDLPTVIMGLARGKKEETEP